MSTFAISHNARPEYARLLEQTLPTVIRSANQNESCIAQVTHLLKRGTSLTVAERELLKLLTLLIESFEEKNYALPESSGIEAVNFLMDQHGLRQKDMNDIFGTPSITSEVLNGKRELNKEQIRRLSERFGVSPALFF